MILNRDRAEKIMVRESLDALIATSPENVTYISDYFNFSPYIFKEMEIYGILPCNRTEEPTLIVPIDALDYLAQRLSWIKDIRSYGTYYIFGSKLENMTPYEQSLYHMRRNLPHYPSALEGLISTLQEKKLSDKRIGLDEWSVPPSMIQTIQMKLPKINLIPSFQLFRQIRVVKTDNQIEYIQKAAEIMEAGIECGFLAVQNGGTELDFARALRMELARQGAIPGLGGSDLSGGTRSAACIPPTDYWYSSGDLLRIDVGCRYDWHYSDTGRTAVFGKPTDKQKRKFDAIFAGYQTAMNLVKPGAATFEIYDAAIAAVRKSGLNEYRRHFIGHGIGLEMYEMPLIGPKNSSIETHKIGESNWILEPNMVINIEVPYYELGFGGLQIEDTLVVTEKGYEYLTKAPRELRIINY